MLVSSERFLRSSLERSCAPMSQTDNFSFKGISFHRCLPKFLSWQILFPRLWQPYIKKGGGIYTSDCVGGFQFRGKGPIEQISLIVFSRSSPGTGLFIIQDWAQATPLPREGLRTNYMRICDTSMSMYGGWRASILQAPVSSYGALYISTFVYHDILLWKKNAQARRRGQPGCLGALSPLGLRCTRLGDSMLCGGSFHQPTPGPNGGPMLRYPGCKLLLPSRTYG